MRPHHQDFLCRLFSLWNLRLRPEATFLVWETAELKMGSDGRRDARLVCCVDGPLDVQTLSWRSGRRCRYLLDLPWNYGREPEVMEDLWVMYSHPSES